MPTWSGTRKKLEEDCLCPALRGRVRYFATTYRESLDHEGRAALLPFSHGGGGVDFGRRKPFVGKKKMLFCCAIIELAVIILIATACFFDNWMYYIFYNLLYPGFRTCQDIALLFAVGIGFALSFQLSGNNLIVSYFVNLPNAFVTYVLKYEQFPKMTGISSVFAVMTMIILTIILLNFEKVSRKEKRVC